MSDDALRALARSAGLDTDWTDFKGQHRPVSIDTLRAVLTALSLPCGDDGQIAYSLRRLDQERAETLPFHVGAAGDRIALPGLSGRLKLVLEDGTAHDLSLEENGTIALPFEPGYHTLQTGDREIGLAVAPPTCWRVQDLVGDKRLFGLAAQVYSLRGGASSGFGDFAALGRLAAGAGPSGAAAIAISPVHALFAADPGRASPYSPSTRLFLNGVYADTSDYVGPEADNSGTLIDWATAGPRKYAQLRAAYEVFRQDRRHEAAFQAFVRDGDEPLLSHARFEALDARFRPRGLYDWRHWPEEWSNAASTAVASLAPTMEDVEFHLFIQFLADRSFGAAQQAAADAGMPVGLIADLAIGMDGAGSHAWSRPSDVLNGLGIGAPPDPLGPDGQNWGLTTFSPRALGLTGFKPFLQTLRAAMRHAKGVRIDHIMGLQRLWVIPQGAGAMDGLYLHYPLADLVKLTALESWRHKAIVIGEDLGTVAPGFRERLHEAGILGMRVLWFERSDRGDFLPPSAWPQNAAAMTTTHDLPTVVGWESGRDIAWREQIDRDHARADAARQERAADKQRLGQAFAAANCQPDASQGPEAVVEAAMAYVGQTPCRLAIVPMEDVLALPEQPNLPGTIDEHPNWRRRLPDEDPFSKPDIHRRLATLRRVRETP